MVNYYEKHYGNLYPGDIAKSSDINQIQQNIQDALKNAIRDLTEGESWILGTNDQTDKDAFILTPASKRSGRYIDQMNLAEGDDVEIISFRETSYRQPIKLARSSIYSVIVKLQNKSEVSVPVVFELRDQDGDLIPNMRTTLTLPKQTNAPAEFEIVFDLEHYPTAHGLASEDLEDSSTDLIQKNTNEGSNEEGKDFSDEQTLESSTTGASVVYLFIEALNRNKFSDFDVNTQQSNGYEWNDVDPTFGIVINKNSQYGQLLEESTGNEFTSSSVPGDLYFKEVYANSPTYKCNLGQAIIGGEKVILADTHISVGGASTSGNVVSYIYMDTNGHLNFKNSDPFTGTTLPTINVSEEHLHIANIITYQNDSKDPVIYQSDEERLYRPRSHHERIRRLEKKLNYTQEIAIPARLKYTRTGEDWIDPNPNIDFTDRYYNPVKAQDLDNLNNKQYVVTTDENGNFIIKMSQAESFSIPITLKNENSGKITTEKDKTKVISSAQTTKYINEIDKSDKVRAQTFAEMKNLVNDFKKGTLVLSSTSKQGDVVVATTAKEAQETEFNPWDDSKQNRPESSDIKPNTRAYTVVKGKNSANDWVSEFPAMTFFTDTGYNLKKLEIPIYKFKNCSGIKFYIYKRQGPNNKTNTVWLEKKITETKVFSLKNAKVKKGYQYMDNGFLIDFTESNKNGLTLPKGQYVIICLPIPTSGKGTVYVDTYKPKNSKDFCIRYHGAGNASHFLLKDRYQEIWYNPVKAIKEDIVYSKKGEVVSGVVSWENKESIKTIKPLINCTQPKGTEVEIWVDTGGGWIKIDKDKSNNVIGSGTGESFRWKVVLKSNSKDTPVISYDKDKKYAIKFEITRATPNTGNSDNQSALESKNLCFTAKPFNANEILREYIGDQNLALTDNKFSNFEFARVWCKDGKEGEDSSNRKNSVLIDISASDRIDPVMIKKSGQNEYVHQTDDNGKELYYPIYSLHYVDLHLDDFSQTSVDYSNYDAFVEDDEYNLRLKLDTENSYNDNDIKIVNPNDFVLMDESFSGSENDDICIDLSRVPSSDVNQILARARFSNTLDLSKYAELRANFDIEGTENGTLAGLGIYISSQYESEAPSMLPSEDLDSALVDELPDLNSSQEEVISQYANQIIRKSYNENGVGYDIYYKSVWDSKEGIWKWEQLHDVKSYNIYELTDRGNNQSPITLSKSEEEHSFFIKVDPDSVNFQFVKEIGIITLKDDEKYSVNNVGKITLKEFDAIKNDYYPVFSAAKKDKFKEISGRTPVEIKATGEMSLGTKQYKNTVPDTSSITITHQDVYESGEDLCTFDLTSKDTTGFNHIGIQIASDCFITKYMLELHFRKIEGNIEKTIEKIRLPTLNYIYYPTTANNTINLSQVFKKIETSDRFDKIVLYATPKFKNYAKQLKTSTENENLGDTITLYIGNISLYKARTIPIFHWVMRMKFYLDEADEQTKEQLGIRKLGTILNYR